MNNDEETYILTEEDIKLLFGETSNNSSSTIYYDDRTGVIRGVSHDTDSEMSERFAHISVDFAVANDFMHGRKNLADWIVIYQGDRPSLVPTTTKNITVMPSQQGWCVVTNTTDSAPVRIIMVVPPDELTGQILLHTDEDVVATAGFDTPFVLRLTKKASPDEVLGEYVIDPKELFENKEINIAFSTKINFDIDIVSKPLTTVSYEIQPFQEASRPLPLPKGRFDDFCVFEEIESVATVDGLSVTIYDDRVVAKLVGGGGRYYNRPISSILIAVCREDDREAMLWQGRISIDDLRLHDQIECELNTTLIGKVSVFSQLYYFNAFMFDSRGKTDNQDNTLLPMTSMDLVMATPFDDKTAGCLLVELNPHRSTVSLSLRNGGGPVYSRVLDSILVALVDPNQPEVCPWSSRVLLSELPCVFQVDPSIINEKFSVMAQRYFINSHWRVSEDTSGSGWVERIPKRQNIDKECLAIWIDKRRSMLRVQAINGGGTHLNADVVRLDVYQVRDPETHITSLYASIDKLDQGEMLGFTIPEEILKGNFEIRAQTVYSSCYILE